jgi:hypothetical protein
VKVRENARRAADLRGCRRYALRERLGEPIPGPDLAHHHQVITQLLEALGHEQYQAAWDLGRSISERQAIELAARTPAEYQRDHVTISRPCEVRPDVPADRQLAVDERRPG